ncbi:MAG: hypothetical protein ACR2OU_21340, partial [Thermomicrobiales bacterium]
MVNDQGRERASDGNENDDQDAQPDTQVTQRFFPRSPLDDLPPMIPKSIPDAEPESIDTAGTDDPSPPAAEPETDDDEPRTADPASEAEVISLPANSDDLATGEPIAESRSVSFEKEKAAPKSESNGATQWLNRLRAATNHQAEPAAPAETSDNAADQTVSAQESSAQASQEPVVESQEADDSQPNPEEQHEPVITIRPGEAAAETSICPVCGNQTDALRFCGYCGAPLGQARVATTETSRADQLWQRIHDLLDPPRHIVSTWPHALTFGGGAVLVILALLSNSAGMALIIACAIVPVLILLTLNQRDVFEQESPLVLACVLVAGGVAGIIVGWLGKIIVTSDWFNTGVLNFGAAGFGGRFAEQEGSPSILVWFINGVLLPLLGLAGMVAAPIALRRFNTYRNEVMDGAILTGAGAAGFAIGTAIVFWAPLFNHGAPSIGVSDWTLMIIGMAIL